MAQFTVKADSLNGKREYEATFEAETKQAARDAFKRDSIPQITKALAVEFNRTPEGVAYLVDYGTITVTEAKDTTGRCKHEFPIGLHCHETD